MAESGIRIVNSSLHHFISNKLARYTSKFTTPQQSSPQHPVPSTQPPAPSLLLPYQNLPHYNSLFHPQADQIHPFFQRGNIQRVSFGPDPIGNDRLSLKII